MTGKASTKTLPVSIKLLTKKQLEARSRKIYGLEMRLRKFRDQVLGPRPVYDYSGPPENFKTSEVLVKAWDVKAKELGPIFEFLFEQRAVLAEVNHD